MTAQRTIDTAFIREWADALVSGEFEQGKSFLRVESDEGAETWCCLGVACELRRRQRPEQIRWTRSETHPARWAIDIDSDDFLRSPAENPPFSLMDQLGLGELGDREHSLVGSSWPTHEDMHYFSLAHANDEGVPFAAIAGWLRDYADEVDQAQGTSEPPHD